MENYLIQVTFIIHQRPNNLPHLLLFLDIFYNYLFKFVQFLCPYLVKIETMVSNEDANGDIEFEFQDGSDEDDEEADDVSKMFLKMSSLTDLFILYEFQ